MRARFQPIQPHLSLHPDDYTDRRVRRGRLEQCSEIKDHSMGRLRKRDQRSIHWLLENIHHIYLSLIEREIIPLGAREGEIKDQTDMRVAPPF